jgi:hypothetical protein
MVGVSLAGVKSLVTVIATLFDVLQQFVADLLPDSYETVKAQLEV